MREKKRILWPSKPQPPDFPIFLLSLSSGDQEFNIGEAFRYLLGQGDDGRAFIMERSACLEFRLPSSRSFARMSGVLLQTFTRNPLADSGTLGINAGAGVIITLLSAS